MKPHPEMIGGPAAAQHSGPKPISVPAEVAARYTNPDQFKRFDTAMRKILAVPHSEIVRREQEYKRQSALNPKRRGPKPKTKVQHGQD